MCIYMYAYVEREREISESIQGFSSGAPGLDMT